MRQHGLFFDHNLHALRIVEDFELRYAAFRGLNLTFEVREGIVKHSRDYRPEEFPQLAEYSLDRRPPLEAQLIDQTDELAYNTADLDDGYEARLLQLEEISEAVPLFADLFRDIERTYPQAPKKLQLNEVLRRILDRWVGDLIETTRAKIDAALPGAGREKAGLDEVRAWPERLVGLSPQAEAERRETKEFLYRRLYFSPALMPEKHSAERIISDLFELWIKHPEKLPPGYQQKAETEPLARVVCDYLAGMTDNYIYEQYEKYFSA